MSKAKHKTHKSAVKRFKITAGGKVLHRSHKLRHLRSKKSKAQIRRLKLMKPVEGRFKTKLKKMLGAA